MKKQYGKMPALNERTRPFFHGSISLYYSTVEQLNEKISIAERKLPDANWQDRLNEYHNQLERLEQMKSSGWFVDAAKCKGLNGMFDWAGFNKYRVAELELEKASLVNLLASASTDEQRQNVRKAIDGVQFRIDDLSTKQLTVAQKQSVIARILKEKTQ